VKTRTEEYWRRSNPEGKEELSWEEYRARQYGFLTDGHVTDRQGRWIGEHISKSCKLGLHFAERILANIFSPEIIIFLQF
jgi:hypothetical protein